MYFQSTDSISQTVLTLKMDLFHQIPLHDLNEQADPCNVFVSPELTVEVNTWSQPVIVTPCTNQTLFQFGWQDYGTYPARWSLGTTASDEHYTVLRDCLRASCMAPTLDRYEDKQATRPESPTSPAHQEALHNDKHTFDKDRTWTQRIEDTFKAKEKEILTLQEIRDHLCINKENETSSPRSTLSASVSNPIASRNFCLHFNRISSRRKGISGGDTARRIRMEGVGERVGSRISLNEQCRHRSVLWYRTTPMSENGSAPKAVLYFRNSTNQNCRSVGIRVSKRSALSLSYCTKKIGRI